ncbi:hypothetical protein L1987_52580 [Smallanthus sonchifolius]|uniref:Uncharacterized protein n=1 Tax=Smallanthus sonchifolius TaxID=185202 RepID=A0ACB9ETI2_9ASTR|nr:hypothetical protein L1987_52580 [Smallanthus sonchifolius]
MILPTYASLLILHTKNRFAPLFLSTLNLERSNHACLLFDLYGVFSITSVLMYIAKRRDHDQKQAHLLLLYQHLIRCKRNIKERRTNRS